MYMKVRNTDKVRMCGLGEFLYREAGHGKAGRTGQGRARQGMVSSG